MVILNPEKDKHYKNIETGEIYEGILYLGIFDSPDNYVLVSEEEYQEYLKHLDE